MRKWHKVFWALVAGTALGAAGCFTAAYGVPEDFSTDDQEDGTDVADGEEVVEDATGDEAADVEDEDTIMNLYGPPTGL
jgi:hypothetical protein